MLPVFPVGHLFALLRITVQRLQAWPSMAGWAHYTSVGDTKKDIFLEPRNLLPPESESQSFTIYGEQRVVLWGSKKLNLNNNS